MTAVRLHGKTVLCGNDTTDKVFALSIGEVTNPDYGFCEDYNTYSVSRWMQASDYAHARGAYAYSSSSYAGNCWWWLRSPGTFTGHAAYVYDDGDVDRYGSTVNLGNDACVPALHLNLSSDLWSAADDGSSVEPDAALAAVKNNAKNALETYKNAADYREAQKKELAAAIAAGKKAIDAAIDEAGASEALQNAKSAIDRIKTAKQLEQEENKKGSGELTIAPISPTWLRSF